MSTLTRCVGLSMCVVLGTAAASANPDFTIETLVLEGDSVPGVGLVTYIDNLAINNLGMWIVEADTDHANTDADSVLIRDGVLYLREGDPLDEPEGASIGSFDSVNINILGDSGWNFFLDGTGGGDDDSGIYLNTDLIIQESDISEAPEFSPGTIYIGFFEVKINDANAMLVVASVDDPNIPTTVDRALVVISSDAQSESVFAKEGDVLPGQTETVADFGTGWSRFDFTNAGDIMFFADLTGDSAADGVIYLNDTLLAQEGSPSPIDGRNWQLLSSRPLDVNDNGDYVFRGNLDGDTADDELLIKNGAKFIQEGDSVPAIAPFTFESFGTTAPVLINDNGDVVWFGHWDNPDTNVDSGIFLNDTLLVQEGVTIVDGQLIDAIPAGEDGLRVSDNGSFIIFEATLADGRHGAFLIEIGCAGDLDGDGDTDQADLGILLADWGCTGGDCPGDLDGDGDTDQADLGILLADWGCTP
ncbi:MAG TPA: hypothetical protein VM487_15345 [Phycisphaerae bacterium]|nr:hypothetical protein [Phycisphaerae bacterium]